MKQIALFMVVLTMAFKPSFAQMRTNSGTNWNKNQVIAHRGAWKANGLPENSIASLKQAIKIGCYGAEFDVHATKDGVLVVNHDADFLGLPIEKSSYQELLEKKMSNGESIPTLEKYLKTGLKQKGTKLILEIKISQAGPEADLVLAEKTVEMVKRLKAEAWVDYISFSYPILQKVLALQPDARVAYLNGDATPEKVKEDHFYGIDYAYKVYKKGEWFAKAKALGLTLNAWTVNDEANMNWLLDNQADFITTNEPEMLFKVIESRK
jgi:glycerophosphoryl diester phosphodiesterase